jgi:hypothetical protein
MLKQTELQAERQQVPSESAAAVVPVSSEALAEMDDDAFGREIDEFLGDNPSPSRIRTAEDILITARSFGVGFDHARRIRERRAEEDRARLAPVVEPVTAADYAMRGLVGVFAAAVAFGLVLLLAGAAALISALFGR